MTHHHPQLSDTARNVSASSSVSYNHTKAKLIIATKHKQKSHLPRMKRRWKLLHNQLFLQIAL